MLLTLLFTYLAFSALGELDFRCMAQAFFPECLSNLFQGLRYTSSELCKRWDVPLSDPYPRYASTITFHCIALL
jgi:hypothetical protein